MNDFSDFQLFFLDDTPNNLASTDSRDVLVGFGGDDLLVGLGAADYVNGNTGADGVYGNAGNDTLHGGKDNDTVGGGTGDDALFGDLGDDVLSGDVGTDTLTGGEGRDRFVLQSNLQGNASLDTADIIRDYRDGEDRLELRQPREFTDLEIAAASNASDTVIRDTTNNEVLAVLQNVAAASLDATDFIGIVPPSGEPTVSFSDSELSVSEADGTATVTVQLSSPSSDPVQVVAATADGTATPDTDYTAVETTLNFAPGEVTQTFEIPVTNDTDAEGDETVRLVLREAIAANLSPTPDATLTLIDDDSSSLPDPAVSVGDSVNFRNVDVTDEAAVRALGGPSVSVGDTTLYIGYEQVGGNNQDPRLVSFTNGVQNWYRTDYEVTGTDGRGVGLLWDGANALYGVFTVDGTQGSPDDDFREFARDGWLESYGAGGGAKVSVVMRIDPQTGDPTNATFISAILSNGNSNTLQVTDLALDGDNLVVNAQSFFSPRRTDTTSMENTGSDTDSPFDYTVEFTSDLSTAVRAEAPGFGS